ncbi:MAG: hypothetical protein EVA89_27595 [Sandaracinaceae bacterium]|nr:MAG: hypothetical protein EVA89_27595 [Sandaracinaceae bacterium]
MRVLIAILLGACGAAPPPVPPAEGPGPSARIEACSPLRFLERVADRPDFVRAASGIAAVEGGWVIAQDDLAWVAVRRPDGGLDALPLPAGPGGARIFEERLGNRDDKPDLESAVTLPDGRALLFGSGASPGRVSVVIVDAAARATRVVDAAPLYAALRARTDLSGSELNLEGAAVVGDALWLFQRGNGAPRDGILPINAVAEISLDAMLAYLDGGPTPPLRRVRAFDLGRAGDVAYGFTDAASDGARVWFLASAEDSPDALQDGPIVGTRVGTIEGERIRWGPVREPDGAPSERKLEGLLLDGDAAWAVTDADDPDRASELCRLTLTRG